MGGGRNVHRQRRYNSGMHTLSGEVGPVSLRAQAILTQAMELPPESRAALAASLLETLEGPEEEGVEEAWSATIQRRMAEVDSGQVQTVPWSEVQMRVRRHLTR